MGTVMLGAVVAAGLSLIAWLVLIVGRGGFWDARPQLPSAASDPVLPGSLPSVVAVIPARNEQDILRKTLPTVLGQSYGGELRVVVVDDRSTDATADVAQQIADAHDASTRLTVLSGRPLPDGWAGKVWAMRQGTDLATSMSADYVWFTDADIAHDPGMLRALVGKARAENLDLASIMAKLRMDSEWDRLLIPAFVYFFAKLYPFRFVNETHRKTAGAAGGCMLVRSQALERAGGLERIRSALIDDCALGQLIKGNGGRIWLGFSTGVRSIRAYGTLRSVWNMVARSAYHQLGYSPLNLLGTVLGMLFLYLTPPAFALAGLVLGMVNIMGGWILAACGATTWGLMSLSFIPILRHQDGRMWNAFFLPIAGMLYTSMTISSAWRHVTGRVRVWRG